MYMKKLQITQFYYSEIKQFKALKRFKMELESAEELTLT